MMAEQQSQDEDQSDEDYAEAIEILKEHLKATTSVLYKNGLLLGGQ